MASDITAGLFALGGAVIGAGASTWHLRTTRRQARRDEQARIVTDFIDALDNYSKLCQRDWFLAAKVDPESHTAARSTDVSIDDIRESARVLSASHTKVQIFVPYCEIRREVDATTAAAFEVSDALEYLEVLKARRSGRNIQFLGTPSESPYDDLVRVQTGLETLMTLTRSRYAASLRDKWWFVSLLKR